MEKEVFLDKFKEILNGIWKLFLKKNEQYATRDALANFATGARMRYGSSTPQAEFEVLKDYMGKHIAHIYNNGLYGDKVRESLGDIVVYCLIAMVMHDVNPLNGEGQNEAEPLQKDTGEPMIFDTMESAFAETLSSMHEEIEELDNLFEHLVYERRKLNAETGTCESCTETKA